MEHFSICRCCDLCGLPFLWSDICSYVICYGLYFIKSIRLKFGFRYISRIRIKVWHSFWFRFEIRNLFSVGNYSRVIVHGPCTTTFSIAMQFYIFVFLLDLIGKCCRSIKQVGRRRAQESHESGGSQREIVWRKERLLWGWNLRDGQERPDDTFWTASKNYQNKSFPFCFVKA